MDVILEDTATAAALRAYGLRGAAIDYVLEMGNAVGVNLAEVIEFVDFL